MVAALVGAAAGCGAAPDDRPDDQPGAGPSSAPSTEPLRTPVGPTPSGGRGPSDDPPQGARERPPLQGIDVSHHQGAVDWEAVAADGMDFAYLKATEGTTFVDPAFAQNRAEALDAGLRVGAYHYLSVCAPVSAGAPQAEHLLEVLGADQREPGALPPAVDVELGDCATPADRATALREVRAFLTTVADALDVRPVVYAFPDTEARYGLFDAVDARAWVRRLGDRPPERRWWLWQRSDSGTVDGVSGPVDLDTLRR